MRTGVAIGLGGFLLLFGAVGPAGAQDAKGEYPRPTTLDVFRSPGGAEEVAFARSAAPPSISGEAEVLVLGDHGYEVAAKGRNGFVCYVQRGWAAGLEDPEFWNPKVRSPICVNAPAAKSVLPPYLELTRWVMAGDAKTVMYARTKAQTAKKALPPLQPGAMSYMMSKQGYLSDTAQHWRPHVMFWTPRMQPAAWGANLPGSPMIGAGVQPLDANSLFMLPVGVWSDGTPAEAHTH